MKKFEAHDHLGSTVDDYAIRSPSHIQAATNTSFVPKPDWGSTHHATLDAITNHLHQLGHAVQKWRRVPRGTAYQVEELANNVQALLSQISDMDAGGQPQGKKAALRELTRAVTHFRILIDELKSNENHPQSFSQGDILNLLTDLSDHTTRAKLAMSNVTAKLH